MPYKDASGYLFDLRADINLTWFQFLCDCATVATDASLSDLDRETAWELFCGRASLLPLPNAPSAPVVSATASTAVSDFLERLTAFTAFKKLDAGLDAVFNERIALIFGTNGSGKSSICAAIKVLATHDPPSTTLRSARAASSIRTGFSFKFRSGAALQRWTSGDALGSCAETIRYFDSVIAQARIEGQVNPNEVVSLSPFRLELFDYCRAFTLAIQAHANTTLSNAFTPLQSAVDGFKATFQSITPQIAEPVQTFGVFQTKALEESLESSLPFTPDDAKALQDAHDDLAPLLSATTKEGMRALQSETQLLRSLQRTVRQFHEKASAISFDALQRTIARAKHLRASQTHANMTLVPFKSLLLAAGTVCDLTTTEVCPLCHRALDEAAEALFVKYTTFLTHDLQREIAETDTEILRARKAFADIRESPPIDMAGVRHLLPNGMAVAIEQCVAVVVAAAPLDVASIAPTTGSNYERHEELRPIIAALDTVINHRQNAITLLTLGHDRLAEEIDALQTKLATLAYRRLLAAHEASLAALIVRCKEYVALRVRFDHTDFATILRKLTNAGKLAFQELVVSDFKARVDKEYRALSGRGLVDFGIELRSRGEQQDIIVEPLIGDVGIQRVLSEGEAKLHALALFLAESEAHPLPILVLDDPVTSFDYNYCGAFVQRLRDLCLANAAMQILVFTHAWDFFVQCQTVLNKAGLGNDMAVMVLEDCAIVREYTEKLPELKTDIEAILGITGEPTRAQKFTLAGEMRRLIEVVVNTYAFNNQRHQYKQRSQAVADFQSFTKLVALTPHESTVLSDRYSDLSITEHDDPRNAYVTKTKAVFRGWYDEIIAIEAAMVARKP